MKLKDVIQSENWKKKDGVWLNRTTYFCKSRKKERVKWIEYIEVICDICGATFLQKKGNEKKYKRKYCSDDCRRDAIKKYYSGRNHMSFKGGRYLHNGYVMVKCWGHHKADKNGYIKEHILVAENHANRKFKPDEVVHHKDKNKSNNDISNLQIMSNSEHRRLHAMELIYSIKDNDIKQAVLVDKKPFTEIANDIGCSQTLISQKAKKIGVKSPYGNYK